MLLETLRKKLNALPRFSFLLDQANNVRRVPDRYGAWIEWQAAHELFDPEVLNGSTAAPIECEPGSPKFVAFLLALRALCEQHQVTLSTSGYDGLQVWDRDDDADPDPIHANGIDDCTKP